MNINVNSYFSGGGLLDTGFLLGGLNLQHGYEIDRVACQVQRDNLGDHVTECDITDKCVLDDSEAHVMAFTYPCTKYSTIADIHGTRTGDELFLHAFRHMAIARPDIFVIENVPGIMKFPVVVEAMTNLPDYFITTFCPVQASQLLPQDRKRVIIIGSRRPFDWSPPEVKNRVTLADIVEEDPRITLPSAIVARMSGKYRDKPIISDPLKGDIAPTCVAHYAKDKSTRLLADKRYPLGVRPYSVREFARLQGVPDWYQFNCSDTEAYRIIGNGVPVVWGEWLATEIKRYYNTKHHTSCQERGTRRESPLPHYIKEIV
jgi:DNA (cytosine-5)-methyltransferase 1